MVGVEYKLFNLQQEEIEEEKTVVIIQQLLGFVIPPNVKINHGPHIHIYASITF